MSAVPQNKSQTEPLTQQRCYHHGGREAVVRCPECGRFFCRECVTEHDQRMLCSTCLAQSKAGRSADRGSWLRLISLLAQGGVGFVLIWYAFYLVGLMLLAIPDAFHEGTIWDAGWWDAQ